jgi:hypothetical protein
LLLVFIELMMESLRVVCGAGRPPDTPDRPLRPPGKGQTGVD